MWWTSSYLFQIDFKVLVLKVPIEVVRRGPIIPKREAPVLWLVDKEELFTLVEVSPRVIVEHSPRLWTERLFCGDLSNGEAGSEEI